jgi:hypothetical protein
MSQHTITRSDVRKATIYGLRRTKADPRSLRLTPGQVRHIKEQGRRRTLRRSLYAATLTLTVTLPWVLLAAHPARADYSDHGTPDVSTVASTHPQTYTPSGGLADTGAPLTSWVIAGLVGIAVGLTLVLLSASKRRPTR